jgi:hypothetical protein
VYVFDQHLNYGFFVFLTLGSACVVLFYVEISTVWEGSLLVLDWTGLDRIALLHGIMVMNGG